MVRAALSRPSTEGTPMRSLSSRTSRRSSGTDPWRLVVRAPRSSRGTRTSFATCFDRSSEPWERYHCGIAGDHRRRGRSDRGRLRLTGASVGASGARDDDFRRWHGLNDSRGLTAGAGVSPRPGPKPSKPPGSRSRRCRRRTSRSSAGLSRRSTDGTSRRCSRAMRTPTSRLSGTRVCPSAGTVYRGTRGSAAGSRIAGAVSTTLRRELDEIHRGGRRRGGRRRVSRGRGKAQRRAEFAAAIAQRLRHSRAARSSACEFFLDRAEALEAAGLRE